MGGKEDSCVKKIPAPREVHPGTEDKKNKHGGGPFRCQGEAISFSGATE